MSIYNVSTNWGIEFTDKGIQIADATDVRDAVMALFVAAFALQNKDLNQSYTTPQGQLVTSLAAIINNKNIDFLTMCNNFDLDKAQGVWLDALCALFNIYRKEAVKTRVSCVCTGLPGTVISGLDSTSPTTASRVADSEGNTYVCITTATIGAGGTVTVDFENEVGGDKACPANTVTTIITTTPGWDTVNNPSVGIVGSDTETDADLRQRFKNYVNNNASGTISAITSAVSSLEGVLDCVGADNPTASSVTVGNYVLQPHTYAISVLGGADGDIAEAMYMKKSMAAQTGNTTVTYTDTETGISYNFLIVRPTKLDYFFKVTLANELSLPAEISSLVKQAIYEDFYNNRVKINSTTYASRFYNAVNSTTENIEIVSILMASQPDGGVISGYGNSVTCDFAQYPYLDINNIQVDFQ